MADLLGMTRPAVTRVKLRALERLQAPAAELADSHREQTFEEREEYVKANDELARQRYEAEWDARDQSVTNRVCPDSVTVGKSVLS